MGPLGKVLVTGAAGFIGRHVVAEARRCGLDVIAVTRNTRRPEWDGDDGVTVLTADLADASVLNDLRAAMDECEAVIHAAASMSGDHRAHLRDTLTATQTVTTAMIGTAATRLVLVSSIAVYDYAQVPSGGSLSEETPIEATETARDGYVHAKVRQEELARDLARKGIDLWLVRPGAVYGPDRLWNGHLGWPVGPVLFRVGGRAQVPVCHVETCARVIVAAAQNHSGDLPELNVLDRHLPSRTNYIELMRKAGWPRLVLPLPAPLLTILSGLTAPLGDKRPGLLRPRVRHARLGRFSWDRNRQDQRFGAPPDIPFETLIEQAMGGSE